MKYQVTSDSDDFILFESRKYEMNKCSEVKRCKGLLRITNNIYIVQIAYMKTGKIIFRSKHSYSNMVKRPPFYDTTVRETTKNDTAKTV